MKFTEFMEFDYNRAKKNGYKPCLGYSDDTEIGHAKNMLHFLIFHRWWSVNSLSKKLKRSNQIIGLMRTVQTKNCIYANRKKQKRKYISSASRYLQSFLNGS